jgi:imidazole glycerol-phosphate synthase subunit HisF
VSGRSRETAAAERGAAVERRAAAPGVTEGRAVEGTAAGRGATGLAIRVVPCLDVAGGRVVKGVRFLDLTDHGDPAEAAERYAAQGADEIVFLDIAAGAESRGTDLGWVRRSAERVFVPLTVGGGVRTVEDASALLAAGADKVGVNSAAFARPELLAELARRFGSQCAVLSIDARRRRVEEAAAGAPGEEGSEPAAAAERRRRGDGEADPLGSASRGNAASRWEVVTAGGRSPTGRDAIEWAVEGVERGAGEILLTSIDADGTRGGYDLELIAAVSRAVPVPVIASGGAGEPGHLVAAARAGAAAVLAASIFHRGTFTVGDVKAALAAAGLPVREEP